jgi:hypothetical protein
MHNICVQTLLFSVIYLRVDFSVWRVMKRSDIAVTVSYFI